MKQNKYDDEQFFNQYSQMLRSQEGLAGAGEWHALKAMLPDFSGKRVLDLGCGFGWHCRWAAEHGAASVLGTDLSQKMLAGARARNSLPGVEYRRMAIEDMDFAPDSFDVVLSSLAFHYVEDFAGVCQKVHRCLAPGGDFVFSVEHPVFTAYGSQDWIYSEDGKPLYWPVDRYFTQGWREAIFLGEAVTKYHKTLTTYVNSLLQNGFALTGLVEPLPDPVLLEQHSEYADELRRPMFLLVSAVRGE